MAGQSNINIMTGQSNINITQNIFIYVKTR